MKEYKELDRETQIQINHLSDILGLPETQKYEKLSHFLRDVRACIEGVTDYNRGLTKREYIATQVIQGALAGTLTGDVVKSTLKITDALIKALEDIND